MGRLHLCREEDPYDIRINFGRDREEDDRGAIRVGGIIGGKNMIEAVLNIHEN